MRLREIISEIFLRKYYPEIDNFIKDLKIDNPNTLKKLGKQKLIDIREKNENLFFYLLFSDYSQLTELKELDNKELNRILGSSENFDKRKENVFSR
jgi:hypothetical protein